MKTTVKELIELLQKSYKKDEILVIDMVSQTEVLELLETEHTVTQEVLDDLECILDDIESMTSRHDNLNVYKIQSVEDYIEKYI